MQTCTGDVAIIIAWLHLNSKGQITASCLSSQYASSFPVDTVCELPFIALLHSARHLKDILLEMSAVHKAQILPVIAKAK